MSAPVVLAVDELVSQLATERAARAAAEAEVARLRPIARISERNPVPILQISADGTLLFTNAAAAFLKAEYQARPTEALGLALQAAVADALAADAPQHRDLAVGERTFRLLAVPILAEAHVLLYFPETTAQQQAEAGLRHSEAAAREQQVFVEQVLNLNPSLIYVRDEQQQIVFSNRAMLALQALRAELAETVGADAAVEAAQLATYAATDRRVLETGQELRTEDRLTLANGEVRWYQSVKRPLAQPGGPTHVLGVSTDITALKTAQHVAEAAATARENFLANMSHEIRTPLNGVLGMASLLAKTPLNKQQRHYLNVVATSGRHLLGVVNDVLDMAKITSGKLELEQIAFNLCDSMGQAVQPLLALAQEKGVAVQGIQLRESCPHPWVLGDPQRLNQILINLVSNAIKFTPAGGRVHVGGYLVRETADTLTTEWRVTDTGVGIAPDKQEVIFQEFAQAYADTSRQFGGTGLGLSICRALVLQMGGHLHVQSVVGEGSTFSFVLTLPKAAAVAAPAPVSAPDVRGRRVLLVEDNAVNRDVAQLLLEGHGVVVDTAPSGFEALELFEQTPYDAILMDIQMPGLNGLEATAYIRQHPNAVLAATPVLALTANAFQTDAEKYRAAGMNDTLAKPFDEAELLGKVAGLFGTSAPVAAPAVQATTNSSQPYDLTLLHHTAHGKPAFVQRILTSFHANVPLSLNELWGYIAAEDWTAAAGLAHKLRPSLHLVGAASLLPIMRILENETAPALARAQAAESFAEGLGELLAALPHEA